MLTAISRFLRDKVKMLFKPHFTVSSHFAMQWNYMGETALLCSTCWLYCYRFKSTQLFILQHGDKLLPQFSLSFFNFVRVNLLICIIIIISTQHCVCLCCIPLFVFSVKAVLQSALFTTQQRLLDPLAV